MMLRSALVCALALPSLVAQRAGAPRPNASGGPLRPDQACYDVRHYDLAVEVHLDSQQIEGELRMRADAVATRARIVAAAERLFADRGIDGVSLVEVGRAAGQRGAQYALYDDRINPDVVALRRERASVRFQSGEHLVDCRYITGTR